MITSIFSLVPFVLMALYGGYTIVQGVRKIRARRVYQDVLFEWSEQPGGSLRNDFPSWLAVMMHRLALIVLGFIALAIMLLKQPSGLELPGLSGFAGILAGGLLFLAWGLLGFGWGFSLFGPLAEAIGGDHHYAVSTQGLIVASQLLPWECFSHFDVDARRNIIYVWSASMPGTPGMVAAPSVPGAALRLAGILKDHLSSSPARPAGPGSRFAFPAIMVLICAPFLALALLLYRAPAGLALVALAGLMWLLLILGGRLIAQLIYGGRTRSLAA